MRDCTICSECNGIFKTREFQSHQKKCKGNIDTERQYVVSGSELAELNTLRNICPAALNKGVSVVGGNDAYSLPHDTGDLGKGTIVGHKEQKPGISKRKQPEAESFNTKRRRSVAESSEAGGKKSTAISLPSMPEEESSTPYSRQRRALIKPDAKAPPSKRLAELTRKKTAAESKSQEIRKGTTSNSKSVDPVDDFQPNSSKIAVEKRKRIPVASKQLSTKLQKMSSKDVKSDTKSLDDLINASSPVKNDAVSNSAVPAKRKTQKTVSNAVHQEDDRCSNASSSSRGKKSKAARQQQHVLICNACNEFCKPDQLRCHVNQQCMGRLRAKSKTTVKGTDLMCLGCALSFGALNQALDHLRTKHCGYYFKHKLKFDRTVATMKKERLTSLNACSVVDRTKEVSTENPAEDLTRNLTDSLKGNNILDLLKDSKIIEDIKGNKVDHIVVMDDADPPNEEEKLITEQQHQDSVAPSDLSTGAVAMASVASPITKEAVPQTENGTPTDSTPKVVFKDGDPAESGVAENVCDEEEEDEELIFTGDDEEFYVGDVDLVTEAKEETYGHQQQIESVAMGNEQAEAVIYYEGGEEAIATGAEEGMEVVVNVEDAAAGVVETTVQETDMTSSAAAEEPTTIYRCEDCGFHDGSEFFVHKHIKRMHEHPDVVCFFCFKQFPSLKWREQHVRTEHAGETYVCDMCPFSTADRASAAKHWKLIHRGRTHYQCTICNYESSSPLNIHYRSKHPETKKCKICGKFVHQLHTHMQEEHSQDPAAFADPPAKSRQQQQQALLPSDEAVFQCLACGEGCTYYNVTKHKDGRCGGELYDAGDNLKCSFCERRYANPSSLQNHVKTAHLGYRYPSQQDISSPCDSCDKVFQTPQKLKEHFRMVHDPKTRTCVHCGEFFPTVLARKLHVQTQHRGVSFDCPYCDFKGTYQRQLRVHVVKHHFESEQNVCQLCGFRTPYDLKNHMEVVHQVTDKEKCPICFQWYRNIEKHKKTHEDGTLKCEICDETFANLTKLWVHKKRHGPRDVFCDICGQGFYGTSGFRRHLMVHAKNGKVRLNSKQRNSNY